tara:strand:- start:37 stop:141 length:105 start_codon:yes stop_codon:yes gene_type:complete
MNLISEKYISKENNPTHRGLNNTHEWFFKNKKII